LKFYFIPVLSLRCLIHTLSEIFLVIIDKHFRLAIINIEKSFVVLPSLGKLNYLDKRRKGVNALNKGIYIRSTSQNMPIWDISESSSDMNKLGDIRIERESTL